MFHEKMVTENSVQLTVVDGLDCIRKEAAASVR